ncbi:hypothetical protein BN1723_017309, partial [Verticillium longisporum]
NGIMNPYKYI